MIRIRDSQFVDEYGRSLLLRGVNLAGSSKIPYKPDGATHLKAGFFDHRNVSFVGRPFPLGEADEHFRRLRAWGFTFLRLLVTWEAIEHAEPGVYDEEYLDYLRAIVIKAGEQGFTLFIDPHQDVWSRFTGGDGAPGWTLEAVGFDITHLHETGAALVHALHGDPLPKMIWPTNESKLAAATMFTLFFGGNDFAPKTLVNSEPVQEYLQRHYIQAIQQVALRLKDLPQVVGYDTLNEPLAGYIGWKALNTNGGELTLGDSPTPFQGMLLGAGLPQEVGVWKLGFASIKKTGTRILNLLGVRAWREGFDCIWRQNGVWDFDQNGTPRLNRPDHFSQVNGRTVDFIQDYYYPFARRFTEAIQPIHPGSMIFVETDPGHQPPRWEEGKTANLVSAPHWYDGLVIVTSTYSPFVAVDYITHQGVIGPGSIRKSINRQLGTFKKSALESLGGAPVLIGETGVPLDLQKKKAYRTGDFSIQIKAMDRSLKAMDDNLLSYTLWNYSPDNSNARGDLWNGEDCSIFSRDQQSDVNDINSGGRALPTVVRPYPMATAGTPLSLSFDYKSHVFQYTFRHDPQITAPTILFVPNLHYLQGYRVEVSDGSYEINREEQLLVFRHTLARDEHSLTIRPFRIDKQGKN